MPSSPAAATGPTDQPDTRQRTWPGPNAGQSDRRGGWPIILTANPLAPYGLPNEAFLPLLLAVLLASVYLTYRLTRRTTRTEVLRVLRSHGDMPASDQGSLAPADLIPSGGIGILGGGANAYARALLVELLTVTADSPNVVLTRNELYRLFEGGFDEAEALVDAYAQRLHVAELLEEAIEHLELHMLISDGEQANPELGGRDRTPIYWIANPGDDDDVVRPLLRDDRIRGVMFGMWRHGPTYTVDLDGIITYAADSKSSSLEGRALPTLTVGQAVAALHPPMGSNAEQPAHTNGSREERRR